ncbi:hypothetical protein Afil01_35560 [Actinorhabdospora filicis]|uniref:Serine aminopeptidase S33 domain-containing protein n=1 Tax=Actinorhabdospora filicis TaxID=1785913 RepID=A0A9W6SKM8_9ACTN|nr:alpha/beta fold hydrolase [Actinorhabdospora filicis]GLZ78749.1 hypothetical protein Afil01_35560 [Actinorhabdospora filicis]
MTTPYAQDHIQHDGHRLGVHRYPQTNGPNILILPAMGVPAGYYRPFAQALAAHRLTVAVTDLRGTGSSTPHPARGHDYGYPELVDDVQIQLTHLREHFAGRPVLLLGHSIGGHLATLHLAGQADPAVHGMALVASGIPWAALLGWRGPLAHAYAAGVLGTARTLGYWPWKGTTGRQPVGVIRGWAHAIRRGTLIPLPGRDLAAVKVPVLSISIDGDGFTPAVTGNYLTDQLTGTTTVRHHYTPHEAGVKKLGHITWARAAGPLAARIADFARAM